MKKNIQRILFIIPLLISGLYSCKKVIYKNDLNSIPDQLVWQDTVLMRAFADNMYLYIPYTWNTLLDSYTDESRAGSPVTNGTVTPDDTTLSYWPYKAIRNINTLIQQLPNAKGSISLRNQLNGEAKFIRAIQYFQMVRYHGGVPIVTVPQALSSDALFVKRNKTSECITFILKELDEAAKLLPSIPSSANIGRASKEAALSLKLRVLMDWASPRFNPSNDASRWQAAYDAGKAALSQLDANGYGLLDSYAPIFLQEMNKEVIFAIRYSNPGRTSNHDAQLRPISLSVNASGGSQPNQQLVDAYPMKDGSDVDSKLTYQQRFKNRDDRFNSTIVYNGETYFGRTQYTYVNSGVDGYRAVSGTYTGYYCKKAIDTSLTSSQAGVSGVDFIAIRYADMLMLTAEAANELGNTTPAYEAIAKLRARAKITPGAGQLYGLIPGMSQTEMRARIQKERFVEFAFEEIRFFDLLRWNLLAPTLNGKVRYGLKLLNPNPAQAPNSSTVFTEILDPVDLQPMIIQTNSNFYPIKRNILLNNKNLEQTKGWENGSFDPLQ